MECHELSFTWTTNADLVSNSIRTLVKSVGELNEAKGNFEKILSLILAIGNYINGDTARGQVSFTLSSHEIQILMHKYVIC